MLQADFINSMSISGCQMLVCAGKLEIRVCYYSVPSASHCLFSSLLKYSPSKSTAFSIELVNLTCTETIGMFQPTPEYQLLLTFTVVAFALETLHLPSLCCYCRRTESQKNEGLLFHLKKILPGTMLRIEIQ